MIENEFDSVAQHFDRDALRVWRSGLRWLRSHEKNFGVLAWEPFFVGLLLERELFASRLLEAGLRRERVLFQLERVKREPKVGNTFHLATIRQELRATDASEEPSDFWTHILSQRLKNLTPEETLSLIGEIVENTVETDWQQEGSRYLDHPGHLDGAGLFADAIIGEVTGNDRAFARTMLSFARQSALDVDINIVRLENRLVVLPSSQVAGVKLGRLANERLAALEARVTNRMRMIEHRVVQEFETLLNKPRLREAEIQEFLEAYPELLSGTSHVGVHAHPVILAGENRLIPDFVLERPGGYARILDLKRPSEQVFVGRGNRRRLASEIHKGIAQLYDYSGAVNNPEERARLQTELGISFAHPELCLVIGRTQNDRDREDLRRLSQRDLRREVHLMTYDALLEEAKGRALYVTSELAAQIPMTEI